MRVYLASGFFNPKQVALVDAIEKIARDAEVNIYSPRRDGPGNLADMTQEDRNKAAAGIFWTNCHEIEEADLILAVIDDRDVGVIWEMGYAYGVDKEIISFSNEGFGMNVMMKGCISHHIIGLDDLKEFFRDFNVTIDDPGHPVVT